MKFISNEGKIVEMNKKKIDQISKKIIQTTNVEQKKWFTGEKNNSNEEKYIQMCKKNSSMSKKKIVQMNQNIIQMCSTKNCSNEQKKIVQMGIKKVQMSEKKLFK